MSQGYAIPAKAGMTNEELFKEFTQDQTKGRNAHPPLFTSTKAPLLRDVKAA